MLRSCRSRLCRSLCVTTLILVGWFASAFASQGEADSSRANSKSKPAGSAPSGIPNDIAELKQQLSEQQKQLAELQRQIEELRRQLPDHSHRNGPAGDSPGIQLQSASATRPVIPAGETERWMPDDSVARGAAPSPAPAGMQSSGDAESAPLQFRIGTANITPVGFLDLTSVWRDTAQGSGIGTNFGAIPSGNTTQGKLTELRLSAQNSRVGSRVDAGIKGAYVIAYWESDFLGFVPGNAAVTSNSDTFRLRLFWVDVRKGKWEVLGGQSWSMITPGRKGISPLPGDLFFSHDIDVNYQLGLTWSRDPQFRLVYHPTDSLAMGFSLESPEQYIGGSAGGSLITLPSTLAAAYASQLNNGGTTLNVPGIHPDIIAKVAFDPKLQSGRALHIEVGALARTFRVWNPLVGRHFRATGSGVQANLGVELFRGFRVLSNNYWSAGGGRYIFGQAPDLVVRGDGSLSPLHASSTVTGIEYTKNNTLLYAYYGGLSIGRSFTADTTDGRFAGYGYPGSPGSQNRSIQEGTVGFTRTFWKDARYGALSLMGQYSYLVRKPWVVTPGQPGSAKANMIFLDLRYALPGSAPSAK